MQISKRRVNPTLQKQLFVTLFQLLADLKRPPEVELGLGDLLTETELITLAKRLAVGYWLTKGRSYENIKANLKVSSATIADIQQRLKSPGWKLALKKVQADEWATIWEQKIKNVFQR